MMMRIEGESKLIIVGDQYVVAAILVHPFDVSGNIGFPLATIIAIGTLETRLFATLVAQMPPQGAFPHEDAGTIRTLIPRVTIAGEILLPFPIETRKIGTCEHRGNSTWLLNASKRTCANTH